MSLVSDTVLRAPAQQALNEWQRQSQLRRLYTVLGVLLILAALCWSVWFADTNNAGHFWDRLPHLFDFLSWLIPSDWNDVWRALFDLPSPADNGTEEFNFVLGRVYLWGNFYLPEYFYLMLVTINVALVSTIIGFIGGISFCFIAARNYSPSNWLLRIPVKRVMELFRAFPEIVIAGMFAAIISIGPVAAIIAISIHCIGALTKLFYEAVENIDMGPDEGLKAVGSSWIERVRYGALPQALPNFLSYTLLRLEINVRASTIIGAVGAVGIGQELKLSISRGFGAKTIALVLLLFVTIFIVDQFSAWLRKRLVGEQAFLLQGIGKWPAPALSPEAASYQERFPQVFHQSFWKRFGPVAFVIGLIGYLVYAFVFFDVGNVIRSGHWERAGLFLSDWVSWNVGVEFRTSSGAVVPRYPKFSPLGDDPHPDWVITNPDGTTTLEVAGNGDAVTMSTTDAFVTKDGQTAHVKLGGDKPVIIGDTPAWIAPNDDGDLLTDFGFPGQIIVENDRVKINRRTFGWPNFVFDTDSPFFGKSLGEDLSLIFAGPDLVQGRPNWQLAFDNFWNNAEWQHGDILVKLLETLVMAFLGTLLGAFVAFPLGFLAARNITPNGTLNWSLKRVFDFLRSVDMLIWALFFTRAFGPGPLAGSAAVFLTEAGTLGKIYSEGLENIDDKPREGITSTGASEILVQRYGVLPQVLPVMLSQTLYQWESNTRGATIIGAVGAGGIGLKLWEAMRTNDNWANVFYMVLLILLVVFTFDAISNALRSRLIGRRN